jgi:hypothetical protein
MEGTLSGPWIRGDEETIPDVNIGAASRRIIITRLKLLFFMETSKIL